MDYNFVPKFTLLVSRSPVFKFHNDYEVSFIFTFTEKSYTVLL